MGILLHEAFTLLNWVKSDLLEWFMWPRQCPVLLHVTEVAETSWNLEALVGRQLRNQGGFWCHREHG